MKKLLMTVAAMAMLATGAHAETSVLRSFRRGYRSRSRMSGRAVQGSAPPGAMRV